MMKRIYCKKCEGRGYIPHVETWDDGDGFGGSRAWYEHCVECDGHGVIEVPMTMADRIRKMSDDEIANVLLDWFCIGNRECYTRNREEVRNEILQWLQSNALV